MPTASPHISHGSNNARRADLDWLRLLAIVVLLLFHSALPFSSFGWHIKDESRSSIIDVVVLYLHEFRLPLLFFVSGGGLALAGARRGPLRLAGDRVKRLLIPLVFGMLVVIPPHAYFEYRARGLGTEGFIGFLPIYFSSGLEPPGHIGFKHLWFIAYLLALSLLLLPALTWLRGRRDDGTLERWSARIRWWHLLLFLPLPWIVNEVFLRKVSWDGTLIRDPAGMIQYGLFVLLGAWAALCASVSDTMARARWLALALGVPAFLLAAGSFIYFKNQGMPRPEAHWPVGMLRAINTTLWVIFWAGTARRYLATAPLWLASANRFIYPSYILHQTFIVIAAFYVVQWSAPILVKYIAIVVLAATATLAGVLIADRLPLLRQCLGIWQTKPKKSLTQTQLEGNPIGQGN